MKNYQFILLLSFLFTSSFSYGQDTLTYDYLYETIALAPKVKTHQNDTIFDKYIILKTKDLESIEKLVIIEDTLEQFYTVQDILADTVITEIVNDKVHINIGKADKPNQFYILGTTPDKKTKSFKKRNNPEFDINEPTNDLEKHYDIKQ